MSTTKKGGVLTIIVSRSGAEALQKVDWTVRLSSAGLVKFIPEDEVEEVTIDEDVKMKGDEAKSQELTEEVSRLRALLSVAEQEKAKAEEEAAEARLRAMNVDDDVIYLKTEPAKNPLPAIVKQEPVDTNEPSISGAGASSWADEMERVDKNKDAGDKATDRSLAAILRAANDDPAVQACRSRFNK